MRRSGVLMSVTSLPSPWGIGTMGASARAFVDFLAEAGQSLWQLLPVGPTGYGDSPYQSFCTFAGNPYLIDLDDLAAEGLLLPSEYEGLSWGDDLARVDYAAIYENRFGVLARAVERLRMRDADELGTFVEREVAWLADYALFMAVKEAEGGAPWSQWPDELRLRRPEALARAREELSERISFWEGVQLLFFRQFFRLKAHAAERGIRLLGDLPIYVAPDSADVWSHPELFQLDDGLRPIEVAGCPPDGFSAEGQLWGNPLYDWDRMRADGFAWWVARASAQLALYDELRIDHFRGFDSFYAIPAGAPDARQGRWRQGPGAELFDVLARELGTERFIAEDLGFLTPSVRDLLERTGLPGMKVLEFAFDSIDGSGGVYLPHNYPRACVAYVGTHDNNTALGWLASALPADADRARRYLGLSAEEGEAWGMMRALWASPADTAIVQMQDLLALGGEARMNVPSTVGSNWRWRALPGFDSPELARRVREQMALCERLPGR